MNPDRIIELASRARDLQKLKDLLDHAKNNPRLTDSLSLTLRRGNFTKTVSLSNSQDISEIFMCLNALVIDIEKSLSKVSEI